MNAIDRYHSLFQAQVATALTRQRDSLEAAARLVARTLSEDRFLYAFGTGHSHLLAEEIFYRAGGLAHACAILEPPLMLHLSASESSAIEQRTGLASQLLARYPIQSGDVLLIASNSGRNAVPVDLAMLARERGIRSIALTSLEHSQAFPSRHPSGKRLFEVADLVLDNAGIPGDAVLEIPGVPRKVGPTSTLVGGFLLNSMIVRAIEIATEAGSVPEIYASSNADVPGWNEALITKYRSRIRHL